MTTPIESSCRSIEDLHQEGYAKDMEAYNYMKDFTRDNLNGNHGDAFVDSAPKMIQSTWEARQLHMQANDQEMQGVRDHIMDNYDANGGEPSCVIL